MYPGGGAEQPQERTRELLKDIQRALRRESWGRNILQLAWTAGPVTYLALQGGYLIAYGEAAPAPLLLYFGGYTVIAGLVAIAVRLIYQVTRGREVERGSRVLRDCLDQLPRLLLAARDEALDSYPEEDARLVAAKHLLANPDASELAVAAGIRDLGGSRDLAYAFQRIEVFRRNGMPARVRAELAGIEPELERLHESLVNRSPDTAKLVISRSRGCAPSKRRGRQRTEGFIERALAAETEDNERLMSLADVEEILTLAIEMLVGRPITLITFEFTGDRAVAERWAALERARREFRARLRSRNSRLRIVAERLSHKVDNVVPSIARIRKLPELRDDIVSALDKWARDLERPRIRRIRKGEIDAFRKAISAYKYLEQSSEQLHAAHAKLIRAAEKYRETIAERMSKSSDPVSFAAEGEDGVRIAEHEIGLDERARLTLARQLRLVLLGAGAWKKETVDLDASAILALAVDVLSSIEDHVALYRSDVQQAIELSRAPTIESLEPGLSADVRAGWAAALVDEVENNPAEYALRRVEQLVRFHGLRLGSKTRARIAQRFGIDEATLASLNQHAEATDSPWVRKPMHVPRKSTELKTIADKLGR
jgi:hypothetical protein